MTKSARVKSAKCFGTSLMLSLFVCWASVALGAEKKAFLIGINDYLANDDGVTAQPQPGWIPEDLNGALNDIELMQHVLTTRFGFSASNIQTLVNEQATRQEILTGLESFIAGVEHDDIVYVHFSGHGSQVHDQEGDEQDGLDETILPYDARTEGVADITDDELGHLLAKLTSPNSLVVLDSCHSGTATRSASVLKARSVQLDPRGEVYVSQPGDDASPPNANANYILMTGAADYQSALDGPIDEGRHYGLFTLSLGRALGRLPSGAVASDIHAEARKEMQRIGEQFGLYAIPDAQIEASAARLRRGILGEAEALLARQDSARMSWVGVSQNPDGTVMISDAARAAMVAGEKLAVFAPGETRFDPDSAQAVVEISEITDARGQARVTSGATSLEAGSRAVLMAPPVPDVQVAVLLDEVPSQPRRSLREAVEAQDGKVTWVEKGQAARFLVDYGEAAFQVYGAGGMQHIATIPADDYALAATKFLKLIERSRQVNDLLALDNPLSDLKVSVKVNPLDQYGGVRGISVVGAADIDAFRVRQPGQRRDRSNSLMLEIEVSKDAFVTVVDIDPEGNVAILFPNSVSQRNGFLIDGYIRARTAVRIPDSLEVNSAGFYWDYVPPTGMDTLRVFAASDLRTAEKLRQYLRQGDSKMVQRGGSAGVARSDLYSVQNSLVTRGAAKEVAPGSSSTPDWSAATVTVIIEE